MMAPKDAGLLFGPARSRKHSTGLVISIVLINGLLSAVHSACPTYSGYLAIFNASHSGDTITTFTSANDALKECDARDDCRGFTSSGDLKSKIFPMYEYDDNGSGSCLYTKLDTLCSNFPGFWAAMDSNVEGNTIASYSSVGAAAAACKADPSCLGFNSRGLTKRRTMPLTTSRRTCFYTKLSTVCPSIQATPFNRTYYVLPDFNSNGGLLSTSASLSQSLLDCSRSAACSGVNSLKQSRSLGSLTSERGTCFYAKRQPNGTVCGTVPLGYLAVVDYDTPGGNISTTPTSMSALDAAKACDADTACRGFSRQNGLVVRKNSTSPLNYARKTCFFIRNDNIGCRAYAGYRAEPNTNHEGDTLSLISGTIDDAYKKCEELESCEGFSSKGVLKKLARPLTVSRGTCFYQKLQVGCVKQYGYNAVPDATVQGTGEDIQTFSLNTLLPTPLTDIRSACNADPDCKGYTSAITAKTAVTKKTIFPLVYSRKQCLYSKAPTGPCDPIDAYNVAIDMDVLDETATLNKYDSVTEAVEACNAESSCLSFNSLGQTKSSTASSYYHGVCLYTKIISPPPTMPSPAPPPNSPPPPPPTYLTS